MVTDEEKIQAVFKAEFMMQHAEAQRFIASLESNFCKYGRLTEKQMHWIDLIYDQIIVGNYGWVYDPSQNKGHTNGRAEKV